MNQESISEQRGEQFRTLIYGLLIKGNLKPKYIEILLNESSMIEYDKAFTSAGANPVYNYENYEQLGDLSINKAIVWYMYRTYPNLQTPEGVKTLARLRINIGSKTSLFQFALKLGFWPFIICTPDEKLRSRKPLLEDCFESFIGVTEFLIDQQIRIGVGWSIVYDILTNIFQSKDGQDIIGGSSMIEGSQINTSYEKLYDPVTRYKETYDYFSKTNLNPNIGEAGGVLEYSREYSRESSKVDHSGRQINDVIKLTVYAIGISSGINRNKQIPGLITINEESREFNMYTKNKVVQKLMSVSNHPLIRIQVYGIGIINFANKKEAEKKAAENALRFLAERGFIKPSKQD